MAEFLQIEIARIHTKDAEATVDGQPVALADLAKLFFSYLCIDTNSLRGSVAELGLPSCRIKTEISKLLN